MIKSIELKNIQSHKETRLDFSAGVNCIVGSSNNGKSAILRGLYWAVYNRPLGIDTLASHWALTDKGNLNDEMSVTVINDNGEIIRRRDKNDNQYVVNGFIQNVVKSDVPEPVSMILSLTDTNIQKQLDEPFLLSKSSGEVAKYFNKAVNLDVIDKVLSNAESIKRKTKQETERTEKDISDLESKKENYAWLETAGSLIDKCEKLEDYCNTLFEAWQRLSDSLDKYNLMKVELDKYSGISAYKIKVERIEKLSSGLDEVCQSGKDLGALINKFEELKNKQYPDFSREKSLVEEIQDKLGALTDFAGESEILLDSLENKKECEECISDCRNKITEYKEMLPDVCPCCGQPMNLCKEK